MAARKYSWEFDLFKKVSNINHVPDVNGDEKQLTTEPDVVKKAIEQSPLTDYMPQHAPPGVLKLRADGVFEGPVISDVDLEGCLRTGTMLVVTFYAEAYRSGNEVNLILHPIDFAVIGQTTDLVRPNIPVTPRNIRIRRTPSDTPKIPRPDFIHIRDDDEDPAGPPYDDDQTDATISSDGTLSPAPKRARIMR